MKIQGFKELLAAVAVFGLLVTHTQALSITDAHYLGSADPGMPANEVDETAYINYLIAMAPGDIDLDVPASEVPVGGSKEYDFRRSANTFSSLETVSVTDALKSSENPAPGPIDIDGVLYILAKYGGVAHVWYVGDLTGDQTLPANLGKGAGLSHYTTFGRISVPDGGATATLLGLTMLGLAAVRGRQEKFRSRHQAKL